MVRLFGVELNPQEANANEGTNSTGGVQDHGQKRKRGDSNCHQCRRNDKERVIRCSRCNKKKYCVTCIARWYPGMEESSIGEACPACRNICNCTACLRSHNKKDLQKPDIELSTKDRVQYSRHTVKVLLPILKHMVAAENTEGEERVKTQELLMKAEKRYQLTDALEIHEAACTCFPSAQRSRSENTMMVKAACRPESSDNYLYCPTAGNPCLKHFQHHLSKGEPIIAHEVLRGMDGLIWEPSVMWRACREHKKKRRLPVMDFDVLNCSNWCQEKINMLQFFDGYSTGFSDGGRQQILKLENWPSSGSFGERLPRHFAEFLQCLPFKHYTRPDGCLNMKVLHELLRLNLGPKMCIGYGADQGLQRGAVTKLQYALSDRVNVLMHTPSIHLEPKQTVDKNEVSPNVEDGQGNHISDPSASTSGNGEIEVLQSSAVWDIFRRKDVSMLEDFLRKHSGELEHTSALHQGAHSVLENVFYLTADDKEKLKKEYGIEPWTFSQTLGDAVFIPAGCPYQIRNLKSCMNVSIDFASSESVVECILHSEESPHSHMYLEDRMQVKGVILQAVNDALEYLDTVTPFTSTNENIASQHEPAGRPSLASMKRELEAMLARIRELLQRIIARESSLGSSS